MRPAPRSKIRRARLVVQKVDTWSVAKLIFLLSIALGIVTVVASVILWLFLQASGAFTGVNQLISSLGTGSTTVDISQMISLGQVALVTTIFCCGEHRGLHPAGYDCCYPVQPGCKAGGWRDPDSE